MKMHMIAFETGPLTEKSELLSGIRFLTDNTHDIITHDTYLELKYKSLTDYPEYGAESAIAKSGRKQAYQAYTISGLFSPYASKRITTAHSHMANLLSPQDVTVPYAPKTHDLINTCGTYILHRLLHDPEDRGWERVEIKEGIDVLKTKELSKKALTISIKGPFVHILWKLTALGVFGKEELKAMRTSLTKSLDRMPEQGVALRKEVDRVQNSALLKKLAMLDRELG